MVVISAKLIDDNDITPLSNHVEIDSDGRCRWEPRYELSVSHCDVDVTWFPFDVQRCELHFIAWRTAEYMLLNISVPYHVDISGFFPSEEWNLMRMCVRCSLRCILFPYCVYVKRKLSYGKQMVN